MKQRPILFSTAMMMALLAGTKTQTRRIIKPKIGTGAFDIVIMKDGTITDIQAKNEHEEHIGTVHSPYGYEGDVLWVRETLYYDDHSGDEWCYQAGNSPVMCEKVGILEKVDKVAIPSIHMPFMACRLFLRIKSVRVERLQDVSREDAIAEGVERVTSVGPLRAMGYKNYTGRTDFVNPVSSYQSLWEKINGPESWKANPWVWVLEFEKINKPIQS